LREFEVVLTRKVVTCVSNYLYAKFGEFWTSRRSLIWISNFGRLKILKIRKRPDPTCHLRQLLKRLRPVATKRTHDTAPGDSVVTVHRRWPPPHVVVTLSSRKVEQREVSPISPRPRARPAIALLYRSLLSTLCRHQLPPSATWTRCCIPEFRLHAAVLVDLTTGALNYFSVLPSPVSLRC
jgi:hypothetical protein